MLARILICVSAFSLAACGGADLTVGGDEDFETTDSALITETNDRSCGVVLRDLSRAVKSTGAIDQSCVSGVCYQAWTAMVDVSNDLVAKGGKAGLAFRIGNSTTISRVTGTLVGDSTEPGFKRFKVRIYKNIAKTTLSFDDAQKVRFNVAAYAAFPDSTRKVDRNRVVGLTDWTWLDSSNAWSISDDVSVCHAGGTPRAFARFSSAWTTELKGTLMQNGHLVIDYDPSRMPQCMGSTYMSQPAWSTVAYVRFSPGGQLNQLPVVGKTATNGWAATPAVFTVPSDAKSADVWFYTSGRSCTGSYDSNFGSNYRFDVQVLRPANVLWAGDLGGSFARDCAHRDGLAEQVTLTGYNRERSCMFVDAETWAPGITDGTNGDRVLAQVLWSIDGANPTVSWARYVEKDGNNFRYQFDLPRGELVYRTWTKLSYRFRFSTDGLNWVYVGGKGDAPLTVVHDSTW